MIVVILCLACMGYLYSELKITSDQVHVAEDKINHLNRLIDEKEKQNLDLQSEIEELTDQHEVRIKSFQDYLERERAKFTEKKIISKEDYFDMVMRNFAYLTRLSSERSWDQGSVTLEKTYKFHSDYEIMYEWFVLKENYLDLELLGFEDAKQVEFYYYKLETCMDGTLLGLDTDATDGWHLQYDKLNDLLWQYELDFELWPPTYVIYAKVTDADDQVITLPYIPLFMMIE